MKWWRSKEQEDLQDYLGGGNKPDTWFQLWKDMMKWIWLFIRQLFSAIFVLLLVLTTVHAKTVLISFDGSGFLEKWREVLDFARANDVKLTFFVSADYFCTYEDIKNHPYWAITEEGPPIVKFRKEKQEGGIKIRFADLRRAIKDGHEIASHLCGHYNGDALKFTFDQ